MSSNITKVLTAMQCTDLEIMFPQECDYRPKRYSFVLNEWPFLFSHPDVDCSEVAPSDPIRNKALQFSPKRRCANVYLRAGPTNICIFSAYSLPRRM